MTKAMRSTEAYATLHERMLAEIRRSGPTGPIEEVRSEPVEAVEDLTAGQYVFSLLSACASVCALPRHMFAEDDINDLRNVRINLARLLERLS